MAEKMTCPVCDAHLSTVLRAVAEGEPCPNCGAPAELIMQVTALQARNADEKLVEQLKDMGMRLAKAEGERDNLRRIVRDVQESVRDAD